MAIVSMIPLATSLRGRNGERIQSEAIKKYIVPSGLKASVGCRAPKSGGGAT